MFDGIVMFSGGLDSTIVAHHLKSMGLKIKLVHYVLPFYSGIGFTHKSILKAAESLGLELDIIEEGLEFASMMKNPYFGFGKNANPCVDCRIRRLIHAKSLMLKYGASFIATGEVAGQRPMSQGIHMMNAIEKRADVKGILLRPLSAKHFPQTIAEQTGLVDREKLFDWKGRSRIVQLEYSKKYNLVHVAPAGGCVLTMIDPSNRFHELAKYSPDFGLNELKLIAYGRHFRISDKCKCVVSRNNSENQIMMKLLEPDNNYLQMADTPGPIGVIRGEYTESDLSQCASLIARYSKEKDAASVNVNLSVNETIVKTVTVKPSDDETCNKLRI
jgi:predicted subunit of tRNA(5-methylaminomethyl-2-thiouridylate) methyltransferase